MAVTNKLARATNYFEFEGTSLDTKPTDKVGVNSKFYELDTGDIYYFTGEVWAKVGAE